MSSGPRWRPPSFLELPKRPDDFGYELEFAMRIIFDKLTTLEDALGVSVTTLGGEDPSISVSLDVLSLTNAPAEAGATAGADWDADLLNRPTELTDGRVSAGLAVSGDVNRAIPAAIDIATIRADRVADVLVDEGGEGRVHPLRLLKSAFSKRETNISVANGSISNQSGAWIVLASATVNVPKNTSSIILNLISDLIGTGTFRWVTVGDNIGYAIHSGGAPASPQVSLRQVSGNSDVTLNNPTTGQGLTLSLYGKGVGGGVKGAGTLDGRMRTSYTLLGGDTVIT